MKCSREKEKKEEGRVPFSEKQKPSQRFSHHFPKETISEDKMEGVGGEAGIKRHRCHSHALGFTLDL